MKIYKIKDSYGTILYINEKTEYHRTAGPAVEWKNGNKAWYINGDRHRIDGPAVEWTNGYKEWWINGIKFTEEEFKRRTTRLSKALYL